MSEVAGHGLEPGHQCQGFQKIPGTASQDLFPGQHGHCAWAFPEGLGSLGSHVHWGVHQFEEILDPLGRQLPGLVRSPQAGDQQRQTPQDAFVTALK